MLDFFVSYASADETWAEWIAWTLEEAGYKVTLQKWDFGAGKNFVLEMQHASAAAQRTIAVLSPDYLKSQFGASEWAAAFARDPEGTTRILVPVRVRECAPEGVLKQIVHIDLVGRDEVSARRTLLDGIKPTRGKPASQPAFPGAERGTKAFPGKQADTSAPQSARATRYIPKIRGALTDLDRRRFVKNSLDAIKEHFRESLAELARRNAGVEVELMSDGPTSFTAEIFVNGAGRARCRIWQGGIFGTDSIGYAEGRGVFGDNSFNEMLTLADDREGVALRATMNVGLGKSSEGLDPNHLSPEQASEYLWRRFTWALGGV